LAGNALSVAAVRATLSEVLTDEAYERMIPLAGRWADGVQGVIDEFDLPWVVKRLGCRAEYWPRPVPPRNGGEAAQDEDEQLDRFLHLFMLNRGILMTPFHNMALMAPQTTAADVDRHTAVLGEAAQALVTKG
jgi:glutamate-1-semialdehyde 2,1-aminomutase